ncbi:MAG: NfeD family protein [Opitutaceae bacterium]
MHKWLFQLLAFCLASAAWGESVLPATAAVAAGARTAGKVERVYVIPVREQIGSPVLYIVRRGLKEAIEQKADAVILDMKTPGGALNTTLEIMEALARFPGTTITFVNHEAISAGAFIAASTQEIWFAPLGKIGAAAPVSSTGQDIDKSMRQKVVSYLKADIRARSEGRGYRGQVVSAMIDEDYELKIEGEVLKPKGELLTLTASEAAKNYGDPARPLLSAGTAKDIADLIAQRFPGASPSLTKLEMTWSETLAVWLNAISPLLLGLGLLALYIEFKTPGFGVFGVVGIVCLSIVFLSNFVAGLSGHEPMVLFALGLVLFAVEIFFLPGVVVLALSGLAMMVAALVWSMADLWPNEPFSVAWNGDAFVGPLTNLGLGVLIAVGLAIALARFLPQGWIWNRLAVSGAVVGAGMPPEVAAEKDALVGRVGVAVTSLFPSGQVEIDGRRYEARLEVDFAGVGTRVRVLKRTDFGVLVEIEKT